MSRARPREVPVARPSAEQFYIPKELLRTEDAPSSQVGGSKQRWMPIEKRPGASKHLQSVHASGRNRLTPKEFVPDADVQRLKSVQDEVDHLKKEMDQFVHDFYMAATSFSTHAKAQQRLIKSLQAGPQENAP